MKPKLFTIVGPTASGKTALALRLARELPAAVVSADSRQVYTGMNIGTAKPRAAWRDAPHGPEIPDVIEAVDHYLLNIREPNQLLTLAEWQQAAFTVIDSIIAGGRTPLLAGGTMLYIDSVVDNYVIPTVAPNHQLRAQLETESADALYAELLQRDPEAQRFIEPHNKRRIIRALEVMQASGAPFSETRRRQAARYDVIPLGLFPGWEKLEGAIRQRAQAMLADGLLAERQQLSDRCGADLPLLKTINYKEAPDLEAMVRANLRYARRQMSWWRGRQNIVWFKDPAAVRLPL
jgi:tRNA dimethylallyltransferase